MWDAMTAPSPALLAALHGTRSPAGLTTARALISRVAALRPDLDVDLAFLDVATPLLGSRLAASSGPVVVVPVLLSAGYHVVDDIPSTASARARVARHLGPDPVLTRVLGERLVDAGGEDADTVALVASPSRRASAAADLADAAGDLASMLSRPVHPLMVDSGLSAALAGLPGRVAVATYLLGEGFFLDTLRTAAAAAGVAAVADPLGAHPSIAELIVRRYADVPI
jgi:sirohydrochlorin ferrochelatase